MLLSYDKMHSMSLTGKSPLQCPGIPHPVQFIKAAKYLRNGSSDAFDKLHHDLIAVTGQSPLDTHFNVPPCSLHKVLILAATYDFQQCGILTNVDSDEPVQPLFKLRNSK